MTFLTPDPASARTTKREIAKPSGSVALTIVNPQGLFDPAPNGFSHAVVAAGGTRLAFIAGQGGEDTSGALLPDFA
ncbi:MAG TPA: hypothetical protein EYH07_18370, partial [Kiloniellaceae bacterium]|nr:hypothetical protein [Kiloniellaceae bacterium]